MTMNGCTHFQCAGCDKIKSISEKNTTAVAFNIYGSATEDKFQHRRFYVMLCDECYGKKKKEKKNDGNNNSKTKRSS